jgi:hypothetical protein
VTAASPKRRTLSSIPHDPSATDRFQSKKNVPVE